MQARSIEAFSRQIPQVDARRLADPPRPHTPTSTGRLSKLLPSMYGTKSKDDEMADLIRIDDPAPPEDDRVGIDPPFFPGPRDPPIGIFPPPGRKPLVKHIPDLKTYRDNFLGSNLEKHFSSNLGPDQVIIQVITPYTNVYTGQTVYLPNPSWKPHQPSHWVEGTTTTIKPFPEGGISVSYLFKKPMIPPGKKPRPWPDLPPRFETMPVGDQQ
jgi:hypothetical protein